MLIRGAVLAAVLALAGCTGGAPVTAPTPAPVPAYSPAPRECPFGPVRADSVPDERVAEQLGDHVPRWLPEGFGLAGVFEGEHGPGGVARWSDERCRQVTVGYWADRTWTPGAGPKVGGWTVEADAPGQCGNYVLGTGRCLGYRAGPGSTGLYVQMMGLDRDEGDRIVRSIPLD